MFTQGKNRLALLGIVALSCSPHVHAQAVDALAPGVRKYLRVSTSRVVLEHVRVIDGTGAAAVSDQNITIEGGKIAAISEGADLPPSDGATILDLRGYSVMPGIVGMHNHLTFFARANPAGDGSS